MTESLKRLLIAGKGTAPEPERQRSADAAAPPKAARKLRRDASACMGVPSLAPTWIIRAWYHFRLQPQSVAGSESEDYEGKRAHNSSPYLRQKISCMEW